MNLNNMRVGGEIVVTATKTGKILNEARKIAKMESPYYPVMDIRPIKQKKPADCSLASIVMVLNYFGVPIAEEWLMAHWYKQIEFSETGASLNKAAEAARYMGLQAQVYEYDIKTLVEEDRLQRPAILFAKFKKDGGHAVVFSGIDAENTYIAEPLLGKFIRISNNDMVEGFIPEGRLACLFRLEGESF